MPSCVPFMACLLTLTCTACTVVKIDGGEVRRYGGSLRLDPFRNASVVTVTSRNYGVVADGHSLLLGYGESRTIVVPDDSHCAAIIIVEKSSDEQLSQWREYFSKYPDVCVEGGTR